VISYGSDYPYGDYYLNNLYTQSSLGEEREKVILSTSLVICSQMAVILTATILHPDITGIKTYRDYNEIEEKLDARSYFL